MILSVDPGKISGIAIWTPEDGTSLSERDFFSTCQIIAELADLGATIVIERFTITARTAQLSQAPWSLEIIGVARFFAESCGQSLVVQTPADAKRFSTDGKLKALGWWHKGGAGHANDAARHLLLYAARHNLINLEEIVGK